MGGVKVGINAYVIAEGHPIGAGGCASTLHADGPGRRTFGKTLAAMVMA